MSWSDPSWNWGSPFGKAHDCAMELRQKLNSRSSREVWAEAAIAGQISIEEMKLAFALRVQHARRAGIDGNGVGWEIMTAMAQCKYEGEGGIEALAQDLEVLLKALAAPKAEGVESGKVQCRIVDALREMRFIDDGL